MSLRTPTEDENGGIPLGTVFPQFVIPAHAGIQVCSPPPISLDTRFRGYDGSGRLAYSGSSLIGHPRSVFSKEVAKSPARRSRNQNDRLVSLV